jgi:hypothetical protein
MYILYVNKNVCVKKVAFIFLLNIKDIFKEGLMEISFLENKQNTYT